MSNKGKNVKVWVRIRPTPEFAHDIIDLQPDSKTINIHCKRDEKQGVVNNQILDWSFGMDGILHNASQEQVYQTVGQNMVTQALEGFNGTLMCYGQTGAGKTFTVTGATENYRHRGLIPRAISQLYREIEDRPEYAINVRISYLEIYNETMFDLLSSLPETMNASQGQQMTIAEEGSVVYVKGLTTHLAQSEEEALNLLFEGETNRAIATHSLNKQSSRSHCIFTVHIESRSRVQSTAKYTTSKLNFVDLAGSERLGKTKSGGKTQQEAMYINKSLSFLEQTVIALADRKRDHVPFRQTKLTHCLKDSIGGTCSTVLIANVWGEAAQIEETISTLRFATRMMCVANEPAINEHYDPAIMVKKLEKEILHLRNELAMHDTLTNRSMVTYEPLSEQQKYEIKQQVRRYLEGSLDEIDIVNVRQIQGVFDSFKELYGQMEKEIEEKLRVKYTLVDKTDPASIAAAQKAGVAITDDGTLVGEADGQSFGVGVAPKSAKAEQSATVSAIKKASLKRKSRERASPTAKGPLSPSHSAKAQDIISPQTPSGEKKDEREAGEPTTPSSTAPPAPAPVQQERPSTPPPRTVAFEEFKAERGSEINRILSENKEILAVKKKAYADLARQINSTKVEIDKSRDKLDALKRERESQGFTYNEDGETIISEEEFLEIKQLKEFKQNYRTDHEELKNLKSEVQYCQKLVDQCRQRLIQEFDDWYAESFLLPADELQTSMAMGLGLRPGALPPYPLQVPEDEQEKFDRLQGELLMENPDSAAFYNAKMRTERRKTYEAAMSQPQPSMRRKPGTPTMEVRTKPPTMLEVQ
ncbi:kinesin-like protein KIF9 [Lingula anatina]|uniref:Kinesin-like protein n=1 Tax=Lingula anatina TaxID=7574 RepID=A0A1S3ISC3_LINAN|nr:kinesin-like protein KIF9 [Lingula anatina]|eukprot:XP_013400973.1 kinesin-like protein KIF9 [Lingula anatina]